MTIGGDATNRIKKSVNLRPDSLEALTALTDRGRQQSEAFNDGLTLLAFLTSQVEAGKEFHLVDPDTGEMSRVFIPGVLPT